MIAYCRLSVKSNSGKRTAPGGPGPLPVRLRTRHASGIYHFTRTRYFRRDSPSAATGTVNRAAKAAVFSYL